MLGADGALGGVSRISFQTAAMKRSIELLGTEVAPIIRAAPSKRGPPTEKETSNAELF